MYCREGRQWKNECRGLIDAQESQNDDHSGDLGAHDCGADDDVVTIMVMMMMMMLLMIMMMMILIKIVDNDDDNPFLEKNEKRDFNLSVF